MEEWSSLEKTSLIYGVVHVDLFKSWNFKKMQITTQKSKTLLKWVFVDS